jgi:hypothetical protein
MRKTATACTMRDYAILVLSSSAPVPHLGWYWNNSDSAVAGWAHLNAGYPACSTCGSPAGCTTGTTMWLTYATCQIGTFFNYDSDSGVQVNRNFKGGCSTSVGHSGGAFFTYSPGGGPGIAGITLQQDCCGTGCGTNATPNTQLRIDHWLSDTMGSLQSMYP